MEAWPLMFLGDRVSETLFLNWFVIVRKCTVPSVWTATEVFL